MEFSLFLCFIHSPVAALIPAFNADAAPPFSLEIIFILSEYFFNISPDESMEPSSITAIISVSG